MPPRTQAGSKELGERIRSRRDELGLTVEQAARRAGVGTKTWARYELGESIRTDKVRGVCAALGWKSLNEGLSDDWEQESRSFIQSIGEDHPAWSAYLAAAFGRKVAVSFCIGSDILGDEIRMDLEALAKLPRGAHLGMLDVSLVLDYLPVQFVPRYDYEFMYTLWQRLALLRETLSRCQQFSVHMVADELLLHLIEAESSDLLEGWQAEPDDELGEEWVTTLCEDDDFSYFLWTPSVHLGERRTYHFNHWFDHVFHEEEADAWYGSIFEYDEYGEAEVVGTTE